MVWLSLVWLSLVWFGLFTHSLFLFPLSPLPLPPPLPPPLPFSVLFFFFFPRIQAAISRAPQAVLARSVDDAAQMVEQHELGVAGFQGVADVISSSKTLVNIKPEKDIHKLTDLPVEIPSLSNRESARAPHQCSLGVAACYLLFMLTRAMLMPSWFQRPFATFNGDYYCEMQKVGIVRIWQDLLGHYNAAVRGGELPWAVGEGGQCYEQETKIPMKADSLESAFSVRGLHCPPAASCLDKTLPCCGVAVSLVYLTSSWLTAC